MQFCGMVHILGESEGNEINISVCWMQIQVHAFTRYIKCHPLMDEFSFDAALSMPSHKEIISAHLVDLSINSWRIKSQILQQ